MGFGDLVVAQLLNGMAISAAGTIQSGFLSLRNLRTYFYALLEIMEGDDMRSNSTASTDTRLEGSLIEGNNLTVRRGERILGSSIDVAVRPGEITEICGPSGSGKSTLIDALLGLIPAGGNLRFSPELDFGSIGFSSPDITFRPQRLRDFLDPGELVSNSELADALWTVGLDEVIGEANIDDLPSTFVSSLSTGQMQRLVLARTLVLGRQLVVWDEPFGTLDRGTAELVINRVFESGKYSEVAFIVVSHQRFENLAVTSRVELG